VSYVRNASLAGFTAALIGAAPTHAENDIQVTSEARLNLVCLGAGTANKPTSSRLQAWDSDGDHVSANIVGNRTVPFDDQVNLWIEADKGKLRMPRVMLPALRGGDEGWFEIRSIEVGEDEITGSVAVNFINHPKLRLDRLTGNISISGRSGNYSGTCQKYDPEAVERRF
jgi:hypothetical protein